MIDTVQAGSVTLTENARRMRARSNSPRARARMRVTFAQKHIDKVEGLARQALLRLQRAEVELERVREQEARGESDPDLTYKRSQSPMACAKREIARAHTRIRKVEGKRSDALVRLIRAEAELAAIKAEESGR